MLQGIGPGGDPAGREFDWTDYERLVSIVKHDLDSLEYNIYHTWMLETKKKLAKMVIPALIESQSLPGFTTTDGGGRLFNRLLNANTQPAFSMDDVLNLLNKVWRSLKSYYMEESVVQQVVTELLKLVGVTSFNDLLMRRNFCSWKRGTRLLFKPRFIILMIFQPCKFSITSLVSRNGASLMVCQRVLCNWSILCKPPSCYSSRRCGLHCKSEYPGH